MTILRIPTEVAVSPEDASQIHYNTIIGRFYDGGADIRTGKNNSWRIEDVVGSRHWGPVLKWLSENFKDRA